MCSDGRIQASDCMVFGPFGFPALAKYDGCEAILPIFSHIRKYLAQWLDRRDQSPLNNNIQARYRELQRIWDSMNATIGCLPLDVASGESVKQLQPLPESYHTFCLPFALFFGQVFWWCERRVHIGTSNPVSHITTLLYAENGPGLLQ